MCIESHHNIPLPPRGRGRTGRREDEWEGGQAVHEREDRRETGQARKRDGGSLQERGRARDRPGKE